MKMDQLIRVGETPYGLGAFALKRFRKDQTIGKIEGQVVEDADYGSDYCMDLGDNRVLEPGEPFRYLNHSCEPNCEIVVYEDDEPPKRSKKRTPVAPDLYLEARRLIRPGEQLTIDYGWPADAAIRCGCASASCRGWIVDPAELHLVGK